MRVSISTYCAWYHAIEIGNNMRHDQVVADNLRKILVESKCNFDSCWLSDQLKKRSIAIRRFKTRRIMDDSDLSSKHLKSRILASLIWMLKPPDLM